MGTVTLLIQLHPQSSPTAPVHKIHKNFLVVVLFRAVWDPLICHPFYEPPQCVQEQFLGVLSLMGGQKPKLELRMGYFLNEGIIRAWKPSFNCLYYHIAQEAHIRRFVVVRV